MAAPLKGYPFTLQPAGTTATGNGNVASPSPEYEHHTVILKGTGTTSSGAISIEEADSADYAGTWSVITSVLATSINTTSSVAVHFIGQVKAVRARVSTIIGGGGSIEALYFGN